MAVLDQLQSDANAALKAGDRERASALRVVLSELQRAVKEGGDDEVAVLQRERKRRLESAEAFREGGRDELAGQAERDAELISSYLPEQIGDEELRALVADAIAQVGAGSPKDMGKVMGIVKAKAAGKADMGAVGARIKAKLGG